MKKTPFKFLIVLVLSGLNSTAQDTIVVEPPAKTYFCPSGGINNSSGLAGLQVEHFVHKKVSLLTAVGLGSWGYKFTGGARYFFRDRFGPGLGISFSTATGLKEVKLQNIEVINSQNEKETRSVYFELKPVYMLNLSYIRSWHVGKKDNRINLELGYSIPLSSKSAANYRLKENLVLTETSQQVMNFIQPGGFIIGLAYCLGL